MNPTPIPMPLTLDPITITLVGGMIVTIIGTLVTGVVTIITALRVTAVTAQQAATTTRIESVAKDTAVVLGHVNSEKSVAEGRENTLKSENALLREMVSDAKGRAGLLAQAAGHAAVIAATPIVQAPALVVPPGPVSHDRREGDSAAEASLHAIDRNTAATAANTARTEAAVADLKGST